MTARVSVIPEEATTDPELTNLDVRILTILGRHGANKGYMQINRKQLAAWAQCVESSVPRSIRRLKDRGYVECIPQAEANGRSAANLYRVKLDQPLEGIAKDTVGAQDMGGPEDTLKNTGAVGTPSKEATADRNKPQQLEGVRDALVLTPPPTAPKKRASKKKGPHTPKRKTTSPSLRSGDVAGKTSHSMPQNWQPEVETREYALGLGFADWEIDAAAIECRDFWLDRPKEKRPGWERTFQRLLRDLREDPKRRAKLKHVRPRLNGDADEAERRRRVANFEFDGSWDHRWGPKPDSRSAAA